MDKDKIYEPLLKKIADNYLAQKNSYQEIRLLTEKQSQIRNQEEINIFTDLASKKEVLFQEITERNDLLKKYKMDIVKALKIEEFTISSLRENLNTPVIDELLFALTEIGDAIKQLETTEKENEENLKRILKLS